MINQFNKKSEVKKQYFMQQFNLQFALSNKYHFTNTIPDFQNLQQSIHIAQSKSNIQINNINHRNQVIIDSLTLNQIKNNEYTDFIKISRQKQMQYTLRNDIQQIQNLDVLQVNNTEKQNSIQNSEQNKQPFCDLNDPTFGGQFQQQIQQEFANNYEKNIQKENSIENFRNFENNSNKENLDQSESDKKKQHSKQKVDESEMQKELEQKHNEINILWNIISNIQKQNSKDENNKLNQLLYNLNNEKND